jgi:hypothetical protein
MSPTPELPTPSNRLPTQKKKGGWKRQNGNQFAVENQALAQRFRHLPTALPGTFQHPPYNPPTGIGGMGAVGSPHFPLCLKQEIGAHDDEDDRDGQGDDRLP